MRRLNMEKQLQLAIFDLDGVIVDTAKYHFLAWKRLADELGIHFTERDNERLKGVSRMRSLEIILEIGGKQKTAAEKQELANRKNTWYVEYIMQMDASEILPGVLPFLQELKDNNIKIALGSASKNAPTILNRLGIAAFFDAIVDGNLVTKAKPDPEVFTLGAELLGIAPEAAVVFEDAQAGIEAALRAGMKAIGVGSPGILQNAHHVIPGFESFDLAQMLKVLGL
ncbi:MAG TPA: beta-phosphoglucomutase [Firmicutes bacterium]|nr:beta-phosphoglucomutase [Bacillota bacterium]